MHMTSNGSAPPTQYDALLSATIAAVKAAGAELVHRFSTEARPADFSQLIDAIRANDDASLALLRHALELARPQAGWVEDELAGGALPLGEWWVVDPVEGNINHIHGLSEWGVSATLVRDNTPILAVVNMPLADKTYTAVTGGGAFENGVRLQASAKSDLNTSIFATGQAKPGESRDTHRRMGASVVEMLGAALVVHVTVPATFQLLQVAAGHIDGFWQHSQVRSGLLAGALTVSEAGGRISSISGHPWTLASRDFVATAAAVHDAAVAVLNTATETLTKEQ